MILITFHSKHFFFIFIFTFFFDKQFIFFFHFFFYFSIEFNLYFFMQNNNILCMNEWMNEKKWDRCMCKDLSRMKKTLFFFSIPIRIVSFVDAEALDDDDDDANSFYFFWSNRVNKMSVERKDCWNETFLSLSLSLFFKTLWFNNIKIWWWWWWQYFLENFCILILSFSDFFSISNSKLKLDLESKIRSNSIEYIMTELVEMFWNLSKRKKNFFFLSLLLDDWKIFFFLANLNRVFIYLISFTFFLAAISAFWNFFFVSDFCLTAFWNFILFYFFAPSLVQHIISSSLSI